MNSLLRKIILHSLATTSILLVFVLPIFLNAADSKGFTEFVPDKCYEAAALDEKTGQVKVSCGWEQLMEMGQNVIRNAIYLAAMAAVVSLVYVGYLLMTSGDNEGNRKKAKEIMGKVIAGIFYTMAAWLLVATILKFLGVKDAYSLLR